MPMLLEKNIKHHIQYNSISKLKEYADSKSIEEIKSNCEVLSNFCDKHCRHPIEIKEDKSELSKGAKTGALTGGAGAFLWLYSSIKDLDSDDPEILLGIAYLALIAFSMGGAVLGAATGAVIESGLEFTGANRLFSSCYRVKLIEDQRIELLNVEKLMNNSLSQLEKAIPIYRP